MRPNQLRLRRRCVVMCPSDFFFQAEDGIRDHCVTGVQTCALPILEFRNRTNLHEVSRKALPRVLRIVQALAAEAERRGHELACVHVREDAYGRSEWKPAQDGRSEERRVGKECRTGWARQN